MASKEESFDLDSLVAAALQLSPERRRDFLSLFPLERRVAIVRRLDGLTDNPDTTLVDDVDADLDEDEVSSAATVIVGNNVGDRSNAVSEISAVQDDVDDKGHGQPAGLSRKACKTVVADHGVDQGTPRDLGDASPTELGNDREHGSGVFLIKLHARGAIGEVFVAYDEKLAREVAIKRIRPELSPSPRRVKRFLREAVITAKLQHPGIVPVYTMGDADGSPHYTMPLVSGVTMAELIRETHESLRYSTSPQRWMSAMRPLLRHFIAVCNAIDYAHIENVLHRDLKPSNILIGTRGQTMVVDWGCAKNLNEPESFGGEGSNVAAEAADDDLANFFDNDIEGATGGADITISGSVMGTVEYMSPEQAAGDNEIVGKPSDIFGLGATLFSLLTSQRCIDHDSADEVRFALAKVKRGEFRRIEEVDSRVPKPIGAICERAMAVDPAQRYATAGDLGRDVEAFLAGDEVSAYSELWHERIMRFGRRHQTLFATLAGILLFGFVALIAVNVVVNRQKDQLVTLNHRLTDAVSTERDLRTRAKRNEDLVVRQLYGNEMLLASEASTEAGGLGRMRELVSHWADKEFDFLRGWEWEHLNSLGSREWWTVAANLTSNQIMTTREQRFVKVFDRGTSTIMTLDLEKQRVKGRQKVDVDCWVIDFNRDQSLIAVGHNDGRIIVKVPGHNGDGFSKVAEHHEHAVRVFDVKWNIGGDLLASCDVQGNVVVWHVGDQKVVARGKDALTDSSKNVLAWSYDGHQLFWTTGRKLLQLDVATKKQEVVIDDGWIVNACNSHEGDLLAYVGPENSIVVADVSGKVLHRFNGHQLFIDSLKWHPREHLLLSGSADGTVRIWNADTKKEIRQLLGHEGHVYAAVWNRLGTRVISGGLPEDAVRVWDVSDVGKEIVDRELQNHPAFDWHPSKDQLVVAEGVDLVIQNRTGDAQWIRAQSRQAPVILGVDFHPTDATIACAAGNGRIWTVDVHAGKQKSLYDAGGGQNHYPASTSRAVQWSPDGKFLAGVGGTGALQVWRVADGELISQDANSGRTLSIAWSPTSQTGSQRVAAVGTDGEIIVFDPHRKETTQRMIQHGWITALAWSPDGTVLAVSDRRKVNLWNANDGSFLKSCDGPSAMVWDVDWSSTQNRFAAFTEDGKVCLWNGETGNYLAKFALHQRMPYCLRWSPDGQRLASTARHGRIVFQEID